MSNHAEILARLERLVLDERLMSASVLQEAVDAATSLVTTLAEGASPRALRAAVLLGKALERLARGVWPLEGDVRAFLADCVRAVSLNTDACAPASSTALSTATPVEGAEDPFLAEPAEADHILLIEDSPEDHRAAPRLSKTEPDATAPASACTRATESVPQVLVVDPPDCSPDCLGTPGGSTVAAAELSARKDEVHDLCIRGSPRAPEILVGIVRSAAHFELRALAAQYLGALKPAGAAEVLCGALVDESPAVRSAALGALVRFGGMLAERAVSRAVGDEDPLVRFEAQLWRSKLSRAPRVSACPLYRSSGLCDRPCARTAPDCDWDPAGSDDFRKCPHWRIENVP